MELNRDLLVMFRQHMMSQQDIDREVMQLHGMLYRTESIENFIKVHEVLDVNRRRIVRNRIDIKKMLLQKKDKKAFIFFNNMN